MEFQVYTHVRLNVPNLPENWGNTVRRLPRNNYIDLQTDCMNTLDRFMDAQEKLISVHNQIRDLCNFTIESDDVMKVQTLSREFRPVWPENAIETTLKQVSKSLPNSVSNNIPAIVAKYKQIVGSNTEKGKLIAICNSNWSRTNKFEEAPSDLKEWVDFFLSLNLNNYNVFSVAKCLKIMCTNSIPEFCAYYLTQQFSSLNDLVNIEHSFAMNYLKKADLIANLSVKDPEPYDFHSLYTDQLDVQGLLDFHNAVCRVPGAKEAIANKELTFENLLSHPLGKQLKNYDNVGHSGCSMSFVFQTMFLVYSQGWDTLVKCRKLNLGIGIENTPVEKLLEYRQPDFALKKILVENIPVTQQLFEQFVELDAFREIEELAKHFSYEFLLKYILKQTRQSKENKMNTMNTLEWYISSTSPSIFVNETDLEHILNLCESLSERKFMKTKTVRQCIQEKNVEIGLSRMYNYNFETHMLKLVDTDKILGGHYKTQYVLNFNITSPQEYFKSLIQDNDSETVAVLLNAGYFDRYFLVSLLDTNVRNKCTDILWKCLKQKL